jgi:hypothetical protein
VLAGSQKYPVRDPFFSMLPRSLNTFMNAITYPAYTVYPFSTRNPRDYRNLLSVYLDAAFFPLLTPEAFKQEAHRLEFASAGDPSSPLEIKGVVYNEMKGAMASAPSIMGRAVGRAVFPDLTYANNSGGDPKAIPELTFDGLRAFHARHYHPSNAYFYTYGNLPLEPTLANIEEAVMGRFARQDLDAGIPDQPRFACPVELEVPLPAGRERDGAEKGAGPPRLAHDPGGRLPGAPRPPGAVARPPRERRLAPAPGPPRVGARERPGRRHRPGRGLPRVGVRGRPQGRGPGGRPEGGGPRAGHPAPPHRGRRGPRDGGRRRPPARARGPRGEQRRPPLRAQAPPRARDGRLPLRWRPVPGAPPRPGPRGARGAAAEGGLLREPHPAPPPREPPPGPRPARAGRRDDRAGGGRGAREARRRQGGPRPRAGGRDRRGRGPPQGAPGGAPGPLGPAHPRAVGGALPLRGGRGPGRGGRGLHRRPLPPAHKRPRLPRPTGELRRARGPPQGSRAGLCLSRPEVGRGAERLPRDGQPDRGEHRRGERRRRPALLADRPRPLRGALHP